jgi:hypothetical protein
MAMFGTPQCLMDFFFECANQRCPSQKKKIELRIPEQQLINTSHNIYL